MVTVTEQHKQLIRVRLATMPPDARMDLLGLMRHEGAPRELISAAETAIVELRKMEQSRPPSVSVPAESSAPKSGHVGTEIGRGIAFVLAVSAAGIFAIIVGLIRGLFSASGSVIRELGKTETPESFVPTESGPARNTPPPMGQTIIHNHYYQ